MPKFLQRQKVILSRSALRTFIALTRPLLRTSENGTGLTLSQVLRLRAERIFI
jgi:hypothetical protein